MSKISITITAADADGTIATIHFDGEVDWENLRADQADQMRDYVPSCLAAVEIGSPHGSFSWSSVTNENHSIRWKAKGAA